MDAADESTRHPNALATPGTLLAFYLLYWYESTNTDANAPARALQVSAYSNVWWDNSISEYTAAMEPAMDKV